MGWISELDWIKYNDLWILKFVYLLDGSYTMVAILEGKCCFFIMIQNR